MQDITSWIIQNAAWELAVIIVVAIMARIYKAIWRKPWKTKHEIVFWATTIIGGLMVLALANAGITRPRQKIDAELLKTLHPHLNCEITAFDVAEMGLKQTNGIPVVILNVRIVNSGSQSIVWKWHLHVEPISGQPLESYPTENPMGNLTIKSQNGNNDVELDRTRYLPNSLLESPVVAGTVRVGWVFFPFKTISHDDLSRYGTKYTLEFQDDEGTKTTETVTINSNGSIY